MVYAISCQDLLFQHKKASTISRSWHDKAKKICNIAIVPSQICDGTIAVLQTFLALSCQLQPIVDVFLC